MIFLKWKRSKEIDFSFVAGMAANMKKSVDHNKARFGTFTGWVKFIEHEYVGPEKFAVLDADLDGGLTTCWAYAVHLFGATETVKQSSCKIINGNIVPILETVFDLKDIYLSTFNYHVISLMLVTNHVSYQDMRTVFISRDRNVVKSTKGDVSKITYSLAFKTKLKSRIQELM